LPSIRIFKNHEDFGLWWQSKAVWRSASRRSPKKFGCGYAALCPFAALAFSRRTTGRIGELRGFTNENASFAPAVSPVSGVRRIGPVMIADLRKKFRQSLARHLTEKNYWLSSNAAVSKLSNLKLSSLNSLWTYIIPS
jgi:hypothetical protein